MIREYILEEKYQIPKSTQNIKTLAREHRQASTSTQMPETSTQAATQQRGEASTQPATQQQRGNGDESTRKKQALKPAEPKVRKPQRVQDKTFDWTIYASFSMVNECQNIEVEGGTHLEACTTTQSVEVADVDNILFGIDIPARYFEAPTEVKAKSDDSEPPPEPDDIPLPAEDEAALIPVVNLEPTEGSGADLDLVQEALLGAGFVVGRKTNKEMESNNLLPEYIWLWR
ncbi:hypothetical protein R1sor_026893 [Riccia sorocarpa]|uniref:Uncharacterized protein n=1 Tax=Riccia sorocarpa TaxID=122646 RepID=A0ABD3GFZ9_9MARC